MWAQCQQVADPIAQAHSLLQTGRLKESEATLRSYLETNPTSAEAHFLLGYTFFCQQKAAESLAEYTEGAKYRRPHATELKVVASDYAILSDYGDADKWFSEVVSEKPDDADAWYLLGRTQYNENDFVHAMSSFERALILHPKHVETENNIGLCWQELNDPKKAQAAFETAIEWQGSTPVDAQPFLNLGTLLANQDQLDKALPYLTKADTLSPDNPKVHEELGDVYTAQQNLPKAQSEMERAVALAPAISALHFKLAKIYRKEGAQDLALKQFEICKQLSTTSSTNKTPNPLEENRTTPH